MGFEISGEFYNPSQNTLRLIHEFEKCILSFMESLIAGSIQFSRSIVKFLFLQGGLGTRICALNFVILLKCPHFLNLLTTREVTRTSSL